MISLIEMERGGFGAAVADSGPGPNKKSDLADEQGRVMETSPLSIPSVESVQELNLENIPDDSLLEPTPHLQDLLSSTPLEFEAKQVKSITPRGPKPGNKERKNTSVFKTIGDN